MDGGWIVFTAVYRVVQPALCFVMTRIQSLPNLYFKFNVISIRSQSWSQFDTKLHIVLDIGHSSSKWTEALLFIFRPSSHLMLYRCMKGFPPRSKLKDDLFSNPKNNSCWYYHYFPRNRLTDRTRHNQIQSDRTRGTVLKRSRKRKCVFT